MGCRKNKSYYVKGRKSASIHIQPLPSRIQVTNTHKFTAPASSQPASRGPTHNQLIANKEQAQHIHPPNQPSKKPGAPIHPPSNQLATFIPQTIHKHQVHHPLLPSRRRQHKHKGSQCISPATAPSRSTREARQGVQEQGEARKKQDGQGQQRRRQGTIDDHPAGITNAARPPSKLNRSSKHEGSTSTRPALPPSTQSGKPSSSQINQ